MVVGNLNVIRKARPEDASAYLSLRLRLYPQNDPALIEREMVEVLNGRPFLEDTVTRGCVQLVAFVLERSKGTLGGFIEGDIRNTTAHPSLMIGYVGSWYVEPDLRRRAWGSKLLRVLEAWVMAQGCTAIGSDCLVSNTVSYLAHTANGYQEIRRGVSGGVRLIYFSKSLTDLSPGARRNTDKVDM